MKYAGLFLYSWLFAEVFFRIFDPQPIMPRYVTGTEWGVRGNIPNAHYRHHTPETDVQFHINGQGMRAEHDYPFAKPAGTCRIALFGDSYFMGYELELDDTFAFRLDKRLNDAGIRADVLNFSVSGFGTAEMIKAYEGYGRQFDPNIVIFQWDEISPDNNVRSGLYRIADAALRPAASSYLPAVALQDLLMKSSLYRFIADNSQVYTFIRERGAEIVQKLLLELRQLSSSDGTRTAAPDAYASALSGELLEYAQREISSEGRALIVIEVPKRIDRVSFESTLDLIPAQTRSRLDILSPISAFRAAANPDTKLYFEKGHGHLTPLGVELLLESAEGAIRQSHQLDNCRSNLN
jgi:hypothetical protein